MDEIIRVEDQYYILLTSPATEGKTRALKDGDTFAVFDARGDFVPMGRREQGLYHEGTRFVSSFECLMCGQRPVLLSSHVKDDNSVFVSDLANGDIVSGDEVILPRDSLHIHRSVFVRDGTCYQRFRLKNYALRPISVLLRFRYSADFADIFEVRGARRERRGRDLPTVADGGRVTLAYEGLDARTRSTHVVFAPAPDRLTDREAAFDLRLDIREERTIDAALQCEDDRHSRPLRPYGDALYEKTRALESSRSGFARVRTSSDRFNRCFRQALSDMDLMLTDTDWGQYPYAGIPWFSTVFSRDGAITALECLWLKPGIAKGVLRCLSATQAIENDPARDAEPGKILHEMRGGEMAALGEIPFGRYYGSVDSTPLFLVLAAEYFRRTGDREFVGEIWPSLERALEWIDRWGDADGDGFVEYHKQSGKGLVQQGWKDSNDSVFHADGTLAQGPIALCEVQAYVYAAKRSLAETAARFGREAMAVTLRRQAEALRARFEEAF